MIVSDKLATWDLLTPYMYGGPVRGMPSIRTLYLGPLIILIPCFMATNSAPKTEVSIVACFFDTHIKVAELQKIKKPVKECLVSLSPLWLLSTIIRRSTSLPSGGGFTYDEKVKAAFV